MTLFTEYYFGNSFIISKSMIITKHEIEVVVLIKKKKHEILKGREIKLKTNIPVQ